MSNNSSKKEIVREKLKAEKTNPIKSLENEIDGCDAQNKPVKNNNKIGEMLQKNQDSMVDNYGENMRKKLNKTKTLKSKTKK
jgi:hypothetical protein